MRRDEGGRIGYVLKMYPRLAETFILNEILAHEAAGLALDIFSLRPPTDGCFHRDLGRVSAVARYLPGPSVRAEFLWAGLCEAHRRWPGADLLDRAEGEEAEAIGGRLQQLPARPGDGAVTWAAASAVRVGSRHQSASGQRITGCR